MSWLPNASLRPPADSRDTGFGWRDILGHDRITIISGVVVSCMIVLFVVVLGRVATLQVSPPKQLGQFAPRVTSISAELSRRGDILDRRGRVLATSRIGYRLFADPKLVDAANLDRVAAEVAGALGLETSEIYQPIAERSSTRFAPLVEVLTDAQYEIARSRLPQWKGFGVLPVLVRENPYGGLAASLIGRVGYDHTGLSGFEGLFNRALSNRDGQLKYLRDNQRRALWIDPVDYVPASDGNNIRLSIDIEIQRIAEEELARKVDEVRANAGRAVVVDPRTGEVLAVAEVIRPPRPGVEPYLDVHESMQPADLARVRSATDPWEPGSIFKPFVWAVATESGIARRNEVIDTHDGAWRVAGGIIHDTFPYRSLTWDAVLVKSSNIGMSTVALRMSRAQLESVFSRFGFSASTACGLPGEHSGLPPRGWSTMTQTNISFGQGVAVTPLQMVRAFCAFARDGTLPMLTIRSVHDMAGLRATIEQRAVSENTALVTRQILRRVMWDGTGKLANEGAQYRMFGKSGTAQMHKKKGGYYDDRYLISMIAGAPLDDPVLVVLVNIEDPDREISHLGGRVCGPVVRDIMNRSLAYLGIPSDLAKDANEKFVPNLGVNR